MPGGNNVVVFGRALGRSAKPLLEHQPVSRPTQARAKKLRPVHVVVDRSPGSDPEWSEFIITIVSPAMLRLPAPISVSGEEGAGITLRALEALGEKEGWDLVVNNRAGIPHRFLLPPRDIT